MCFLFFKSEFDLSMIEQSAENNLEEKKGDMPTKYSAILDLSSADKGDVR